MASIDESQIEKLIEDISTIKSILKKNKPLLHQIFLAKPFRIVAIIEGISIILFCLLYYVLMRHYGGYELIPSLIRSIINFAIVLAWMMVEFLKYREPSMIQILKEYFSFRMLHVLGTVLAGMILLCVYLIEHNRFDYLVPTISIGMGLVSIFVGALTEVRSYLLSGYWFCISGGMFIVFNSVPILVTAATTLGCGYLIFAIPGQKEGSRGHR